MPKTHADIINEVTGVHQADTETSADTKTEAPAKTEAEKPPEGEIAPEPEVKTGADGKPLSRMVPHEALHESRLREKEARAEIQTVREKMAKMEVAFEQLQKDIAPKTEAPKIPEFEQDPAAHLKAQLDEANRKIAAMEERTGKQDADSQQARHEAQLLEQYAGHVKAFSAIQPDFQKAYEFLGKAVDEDLIARGFEDPTERARVIQYEEGLLVGRAMYAKKDPAALIYNYAKSRGYKPAEVDDKLERLEKGAKAARSLGGSKASAEANLTLERLAELMDTDPTAADAAWEKAKRQGVLG